MISKGVKMTPQDFQCKIKQSADNVVSEFESFKPPIHATEKKTDTKNNRKNLVELADKDLVKPENRNLVEFEDRNLVEFEDRDLVKLLNGDLVELVR